MIYIKFELSGGSVSLNIIEKCWQSKKIHGTKYEGLTLKENCQNCARVQDPPNDILEQRRHSAPGSLGQKEIFYLKSSPVGGLFEMLFFIPSSGYVVD